MINILSDKKCDLSFCQLKLGASSSFDSKILHRRKPLKHFGYSYLTKTFDFDNGKKILDKCEKETKEKYKDVISGKRKTLITCPPHFIYISKLKNDSSVMESEIDRLMEENEANDIELKDIQDFRKVYLPQAGERDVFDPLIGSLFHHPGIFINGFEPNQYLKEFHQAAEDLRSRIFARKIESIISSWMPLIGKHFSKSEINHWHKIKGDVILKELHRIMETENKSKNILNEAARRFKIQDEYTKEDVEKNLHSVLKSVSKNSYFEIFKDIYKFNELEEKLLECNGTNEKEIEEMIDSILEGNENQKSELMVTGKTEMESTEKANSKISERKIDKFLMKKLKLTAKKFEEKNHLLADVRTSLKQTLYEYFTKPPGEWDFFIVLSHLKVLLNVEVKQQIDLKGRKMHQLNSSLVSASHQCEEHADYAARVFAPFLGDDWKFVKMAAILPGKLNYSTICHHCKPFIITGKNEKEIRTKIDDVRDLLIREFRSEDTKEADEILLSLTKVLIGLSSISTEHPDSGGAWRQIQGRDQDHVSLSAGWTKSDSEMTKDEMKFKKLLSESHNFNKLVYYNVDQQHILSNQLRLVVLKADFGAGMINCIYI